MIPEQIAFVLLEMLLRRCASAVIMRAGMSGARLRHGSAEKTPLLNRRYPCASTIGRVWGAGETLRYVTPLRLSACDTRNGA